MIIKKIKRIAALILLAWGVGVICFGILSNNLKLSDFQEWQFLALIILPGIAGYFLLDAKIKNFYIQRVVQIILFIKTGLVIAGPVFPSLCPPRRIGFFVRESNIRDLCREPYLITFLGAILIFLATVWWYKNTKKDNVSKTKLD